MSRRSYRRSRTKGAKILRFMRQKSGLTLREAASKVGISNCMISHIEVGREDIPKGRLEALVQAYGFTVEDFEAYMHGRRLPVSYRDECVEMVKAMGEDQLKPVHAFLASLAK